MSTPAPTTSLPGLTKARVRWRRLTHAGLVLSTVAVATALLVHLLRHDGLTGLEAALIVVFVPLVYQLAAGFWLALVGMWVAHKGDSLDLRKMLPPDPGPGAGPVSPVAIVMPVFNEDVTRVFEGLRAMHTSLERTGRLHQFDFFVISDSNNPNNWVEEEIAWLDMCSELNAFGKLFYRKRRLSLNKKSGNVADFCRRWGKKYRYMLVLDADSLMTGDLIVEMVRIMDAHPEMGILQTAPKIVNADSMFGRLIQFAQSLYGEAYMHGLNYVQMGDATFWGHNAIVRLAPFIEHCALPELPGNSRILSHDFVEAALMRKAGLWVWLLPADAGSYEETPPTLIDFLKRERRWCQGNMQHFWLLFAKGWKRQSRMHFLHGMLSYLASPLWFAFLLLATAIARQGEGPVDWPTRKSGILLFAMTLGLLFVPKLAITARAMFGPAVRTYGGRLRLALGCVGDTILFTLLAPVAMVFRSKFVWATMSGQEARWVAQRRKSDSAIDWREPILTFGGVTALAVAWGVVAWRVSPSFFFWLSPVLLGLALAIPYAIVTAGNALPSLFVTPEETEPPQLLRDLEHNLRVAREIPQMLPELARHSGLMEALLDPYINALHVSLLRQRSSAAPRPRQYLEGIKTRLIRNGPDALTPREIKSLMYNPDVMLQLHYDLWSASAADLAPWWVQAMRHYNLSKG